VYPLGRLPGAGGWAGTESRRVLAEKIPFLLVSAAGAAAAFAAIRPWGGLSSLADLGIAERAAVSAYGLAFYLWKTLVPIGLSPLYPLPQPLDPLTLPFVASAGVVVGLSAVAIRCRRRWPWLGPVWAASAITALPVLGVFQNGSQIAADRYTYLPMLGWALLGGAAISRGAERWAGAGAGRPLGGIVLAAGLAAVIALAALTSRQSLVWQDSLTLWNHAVALDPRSAQARVYLGGALLASGQPAAAARHLEIALALDSRNAEALIGLAAASAATGRTDEAVRAARAAARLRPADAEIRFHLGEALSAAGRPEEALGAYQEAIRLGPGRPAPAYRAAVTLAELGRSREATTALAEAQRVGRAADPADPEAERAAALVYTHVAPALAIEAWERYLALIRHSPATDLRAMRKALDAALSLEALRRQQHGPAAPSRR
jgi:Flp pilus assembly protein TadD